MGQFVRCDCDGCCASCVGRRRARERTARYRANGSTAAPPEDRVALDGVDAPGDWMRQAACKSEFRNHKGVPSRYPTWDEIADARDHLLPADVDFVMWLPKAGDYVALHPTTFHLHEHPPRDAEVAA